MTQLPAQDRCLVMGVVNVTPDSFSDGGQWYGADAAIAHGLDLAAQGADIVSMETVSPARTSSVTTGPIRRSSSASSMRCAPGRVDSPPTSTMSAPCAASSRPCPMAASAPYHWPPSENESGVTFTTPMTRQRSWAGS